MRRTVLITGASAGIGAALARTYAAEGWNVILTARRQAPLQALAADLTAAHGVTATVIPEDLSDPAAPERLWQASLDRLSYNPFHAYMSARIQALLEAPQTGTAGTGQP